MKVKNIIGCTTNSRYALLEFKDTFTFEIYDYGYPHTILYNNTFKVRLLGESNIYDWFPKELVISNVNNQNEFILKPQESTLFTVFGFDNNSCLYKDTITIQVLKDSCKKIYPTKIITSNGDGFNDIWIIHNIEFFPFNKIVIRNSINEVARTFTNFHPSNKWGELQKFDFQLENGSYYYKIELFKDADYKQYKCEGVKKGIVIIRNQN